MKTEQLKKLASNGLKAATVSRGPRKGMLLAKCPPVNTVGAAVWQAVITVANPFKIGLAHMMFMDKENREVCEFVKRVINKKGIDVRGLDRDRKALENLGVW